MMVKEMDWAKNIKPIIKGASVWIAASSPTCTLIRFGIFWVICMCFCRFCCCCAFAYVTSNEMILFSVVAMIACLMNVAGVAPNVAPVVVLNAAHCVVNAVPVALIVAHVLEKAVVGICRALSKELPPNFNCSNICISRLYAKQIYCS